MTLAIETHYNGYKFRSRLEARWAMFFDEIEINYQYEIEGYDLHYHGRYLPDFYLPEFKVFIEIKPENPDGFMLFAKPIELAISKGVGGLVIMGDTLEYETVVICKNNGFCATTNKFLVFEKQTGFIRFASENPHEEQAKLAREARFEFGETPKPKNNNGNSTACGDLQEKWDELRDKVGIILKERDMGMVQGLLNAGQLAGMDDNKITIYFPSTLLKNRIDKYNPYIQNIFFEVLGGIPKKIEFITEQGKNQVNICENSSSLNNKDYDINELTLIMIENFRKANFCSSIFSPGNIEFLKDLEIWFEVHDSLTEDQFKWLTKYYTVANKRGGVPPL